MADDAKPAPGPLARRVTAAFILDGGRVLVARRKKGDRFGGLWEFPGGKVEPGEIPEASLRRELREELGIGVEVGECLCARDFRAGEVRMELLVFRARIVSGEVACLDHDEVRWVAPGELAGLALTDPDREALADLFPGGGEDR